MCIQRVFSVIVMPRCGITTHISDRSADACLCAKSDVLYERFGRSRLALIVDEIPVAIVASVREVSACVDRVACDDDEMPKSSQCQVNAGLTLCCY